MEIAEAGLLFRKIAGLACGVIEQEGAAAIVGGALNRAKDEIVEAVFGEPVRGGKGVGKGAAGGRRDVFGEMGDQIVNQIVAAGVSGDCQYWNGAVRRQRAIDAGLGGQRQNGDRLEPWMLRGGRRKMAQSGKMRAALGDGGGPVEACHWSSPFAG